MTVQQALAELEALGDEGMRAYNARSGAGEKQFGVKLGDIRKVAKKAKRDHSLALALWKTGIVEARFLATLVIDPKRLSADELDGMVRSLTWDRVADWLNSYVVKEHPEREALRDRWMKSNDPWSLRAGWDLTSQRVARSPEGLDLGRLLDRIEKELGKAAPEARWTMNFALIAIGTHHPALRERAVRIGEKVGAYRDYPCSKGCVSPFAPIAIREMAKRQA
ncbi:MAG TPA: DNA alkylation repair protein [Planctomycetota bacterium]|nr:DNA alkylation repair protein [Planctomycetota bacterium]